MARDFGHEDIFRLLMDRTPAEVKLALACELGDQAAFQELLVRQPGLAKNLTEEDRRTLPNAAQNNNTEAVRLMLEAGWPVDTRGEMGATALYWAAFNGNADDSRDSSIQAYSRIEIARLRIDRARLGYIRVG